MQLLARVTSEFNEVGVYETSELFGRTGRFRVMGFADEAVQGAMDLKDPQRIVLEYQRAVIHLMDVNAPSFEDALVIGHGIGTIAGHYPGKRFVVAEVDDKVVELSRQYFGYRMDNVAIGDGRTILEERKPASLDYVILDAFTSKGTPRHLTTLEFFALAKDKLRSEGAVILNLTGKSRNDRLTAAIHTTLRETFPFVKAYYLPVVGSGANDSGNVIIVGGNRLIQAEARLMAGFTEISIEQGHLIRDN